MTTAAGGTRSAGGTSDLVGDDEAVRERALARIAVRPPYFGLGGMEIIGDGIVSAVIPAAPPPEPERGPMEAAQVARHLAILGSCAAALQRNDDEVHHYLATEAHFARLAGGPTTVTGGVLRAEAVASWIDRRTARALVKLSTIDGHGSHLLDVRYSVLAPKMFHRLHPPLDLDAETELADGAASDSGDRPAADSTFADAVIATTGEGSITVDCGPIAVADCRGHFPGYPAAPVAIVMGRLCRAAGLALQEALGDDVGYRIEEGHVTASRLARAGQGLTLEARYRGPEPAGHSVGGTALADGEPVGEVVVSLAAVGQGERGATVR